MIKIVKLADNDGLNETSKTTASIVQASRSVLLHPAVVVAKLKYLISTDSTLAKLYEEDPTRFYEKAMLLIQTVPWIVDRPQILTSVLKKMLSHSSMDPSEITELVNKLTNIQEKQAPLSRAIFLPKIKTSQHNYQQKPNDKSINTIPDRDVDYPRPSFRSITQEPNRNKITLNFPSERNVDYPRTSFPSITQKSDKDKITLDFPSERNVDYPRPSFPSITQKPDSFQISPTTLSGELPTSQQRTQKSPDLINITGDKPISPQTGQLDTAQKTDTDQTEHRQPQAGKKGKWTPVDLISIGAVLTKLFVDPFISKFVPGGIGKIAFFESLWTAFVKNKWLGPIGVALQRKDEDYLAAFAKNLAITASLVWFGPEFVCRVLALLTSDEELRDKLLNFEKLYSGRELSRLSPEEVDRLVRQYFESLRKNEYGVQDKVKNFVDQNPSLLRRAATFISDTYKNIIEALEKTPILNESLNKLSNIFHAFGEYSLLKIFGWRRLTDDEAIILSKKIRSTLQNIFFNNETVNNLSQTLQQSLGIQETELKSLLDRAFPGDPEPVKLIKGYLGVRHIANEQLITQISKSTALIDSYLEPSKLILFYSDREGIYQMQEKMCDLVAHYSGLKTLDQPIHVWRSSMPEHFRLQQALVVAEFAEIIGTLKILRGDSSRLLSADSLTTEDVLLAMRLIDPNGHAARIWLSSLRHDSSKFYLAITPDNQYLRNVEKDLGIRMDMNFPEQLQGLVNQAARSEASLSSIISSAELNKNARLMTDEALRYNAAHLLRSSIVRLATEEQQGFIPRIIDRINDAATRNDYRDPDIDRLFSFIEAVTVSKVLPEAYFADLRFRENLETIPRAKGLVFDFIQYSYYKPPEGVSQQKHVLTPDSLNILEIFNNCPDMIAADPSIVRFYSNLSQRDLETIFSPEGGFDYKVFKSVVKDHRIYDYLPIMKKSFFKRWQSLKNELIQAFDQFQANSNPETLAALERASRNVNLFLQKFDEIILKPDEESLASSREFNEKVRQDLNSSISARHSIATLMEILSNHNRQYEALRQRGDRVSLTKDEQFQIRKDLINLILAMDSLSETVVHDTTYNPANFYKRRVELVTVHPEPSSIPRQPPTAESPIPTRERISPPREQQRRTLESPTILPDFSRIPGEGAYLPPIGKVSPPARDGVRNGTGNGTTNGHTRHETSLLERLQQGETRQVKKVIIRLDSSQIPRRYREFSFPMNRLLDRINQSLDMDSIIHEAASTNGENLILRRSIELSESEKVQNFLKAYAEAGLGPYANRKAEEYRSALESVGIRPKRLEFTPNMTVDEADKRIFNFGSESTIMGAGLILPDIQLDPNGRKVDTVRAMALAVDPKVITPEKVREAHKLGRISPVFGSTPPWRGGVRWKQGVDIAGKTLTSIVLAIAMTEYQRRSQQSNQTQQQSQPNPILLQNKQQ